MKILLRGSWQTVNIGDIAHSPGILRILKEHLPDCEITLWAGKLTDSVRQMIHSLFPDVAIVEGKISDGDSALLAAVDSCDFYLHASAAKLVYRDTYDFYNRTGKPFGLFGVTLDPNAPFNQNLPLEKELLDQAAFIFCRDSHSLSYARQSGIQAKTLEFGCDGAFAFNFENTSAAKRTMEKYRLEAGNYVCCIPRNRLSPYWKMKAGVPFNERTNSYNQAMEDSDHEPLRIAIEKIVEQTDLKVFLCPEDQSQIELGKRVLLDKLSVQAQQRTVLKEEFWLPDEALAIYKRSLGVFGCEMHSPIMCIGNGIPAIVARWHEQTTKGYMFSDLGISRWLFDFDSANEKSRFPDTVLSMLCDRETSLAYAEQGRIAAFKTYDYMCNEILQYC